MSEIDEILIQIEDLRKKLNTLIKEKHTLLDPKVIAASQMLDSMLNEYDRIVKKWTSKRGRGKCFSFLYIKKKVRDVKIEKVLKVQQPDIHKKLRKQNGKKRSRRGKKGHLSFSDVMELMKHNS